MIIKEEDRVIIFYPNPRREIILTPEEYEELCNMIRCLSHHIEIKKPLIKKIK